MRDHTTAQETGPRDTQCDAREVNAALEWTAGRTADMHGGQATDYLASLRVRLLGFGYSRTEAVRKGTENGTTPGRTRRTSRRPDRSPGTRLPMTTKRPG
ncbi:hypothetical protein GCM10010121_082980 [Streptomyces brasiliensis]|uniref:Uncharacterized protein n=1 Tax=Streptomyces brasiliensis TaxID=1954 RepID=A0A917LE23_9ACTN|nr:hypothetical protein GCM10010121_082980 [Streptomyces brasiliensis]